MIKYFKKHKIGLIIWIIFIIFIVISNINSIIYVFNAPHEKKIPEKYLIIQQETLKKQKDYLKKLEICGNSDDIVDNIKFKKVVTGKDFTCALSLNGDVACWGANDKGQLGLGCNLDKDIPYRIKNLEGAVDISAGIDHVCAVIKDGTVKCWGSGEYRKLGQKELKSFSKEKYKNSNTPILVEGFSDAILVSVGDKSSCAVIKDGTVKCWGEGGLDLRHFNKVDYDIDGEMVVIPIINLVNVVKISVGDNVACAIIKDGTVKCWGDDYGYKKINKKGPFYDYEPIIFEYLKKVQDISVGHDHVCAVIQDGTVKCWGSGSMSRFGDGRLNTREDYPFKIKELNNIESVTVGRSHTCVEGISGDTKCWSSGGYGKLGNGNTNYEKYPKIISGLKVKQIDAGVNHTCAIIKDGTVKCWGANIRGQIGNPSAFYAQLDPINPLFYPNSK
ncbi:MAG: hypothetical protein KAI16_00255 [Candidatus Pacebacteria bacterium]|nr:hypothetical protein [Candidatus Paceibacterota bacterium]